MSERLTGAHILMRSLIDHEVDTIFGYPGGAIMPTYDALYHFKNRIRHILVRHEQGATHMAEGYARIKGETGVVLVTSGPGGTNTVTGLADAYMDSTPMIVVSGQVPRAMIGTQAFQEAPIIDIVKPITKWAYQVKCADEISESIDKAFKIATGGRPGPVLIDIPKDVQNELGEYVKTNIDTCQKLLPGLTSETLAQLEQAGSLLNQAKRPFILAGQGILISKATKELKSLAEKANIPVANTLHGLSSFPATHHLFVGMLGMHGRYGANVLTNQADTILAVGMRFDDRVTGKVSEYGKQAKIIHIDIDPTQLNRIIKAEVAINADAKDALKVLLEKVSPNDHKDWIEKFRQYDEIEDEKVTKKLLSPDNLEITMASVMNLISQKTEGKAIIVADVGQHQMVAAQRYRPTLPQSFITSGGMGTMGYALPAAIGAKIADPSREVIAIIGDGSFQMTSQELGTIMQEDLPIKMVVLNNGYLGMVRQWQDKFFKGRHSFVDMKNPDFVKLAKAYDLQGERVRKPQGFWGRMISSLSSIGLPIDKFTDQKDVGKALDRMLSAKGSYLLDIKVLKDENVYPMMPPGVAVDQILLE